jgi:hypothetical protein
VSELALVVPFEELAPVVDDLRERTCGTKPSHPAELDNAAATAKTRFPVRARARRAVLPEELEPHRSCESASFELAEQ